QGQPFVHQLLHLLERVAPRHGGGIEDARRRHVHVVRPRLQIEERCIEPSQSLHGHSLPYFRSRDSLRSARGFPPVWQVGQYCSDLVANETSRTVSPHTGQGWPVRPWTRIPDFFSDFRPAAGKPSDRSTASVSTRRRAAHRRSTSSADSFPACRKGDSLATNRASSEYAFPTPAMATCSVSTPFTCWLPCSASTLPRAAASKDGSSTSGPSRAMPGTSSSDRTT